MSHPGGLGRVLIAGASGLCSDVADAVADDGGQPIVMGPVAPRRSHVHFAVDLADTTMTEAVVEFIAADGLDAVVMCAAIELCSPMATVRSEDWERVVQWNPMDTAAVIRASMGALLESQGQVITVMSPLGRRAMPDASASGVVDVTRALSAEIGQRLRFTCVMPGRMDAPFVDSRPQDHHRSAGAPLMDPADLARVVVGVLHRSANAEMVIAAGGETSGPWRRPGALEES